MIAHSFPVISTPPPSPPLGTTAGGSGISMEEGFSCKLDHTRTSKVNIQFMIPVLARRNRKAPRCWGGGHFHTNVGKQQVGPHIHRGNFHVKAKLRPA